MHLTTANHSLCWKSGSQPRVCASTVRQNFAQLYEATTRPSIGAQDKAELLLDALDTFRGEYAKIPDDVRAIMNVLRGQQRTILNLPLEQTYQEGLEWLGNSIYRNSETWLSIHITRVKNRNIISVLSHSNVQQ